MTITDRELMAIFKKPEGDARFIRSADSAEWLERVLYFAARNREAA